MLKRKKKTEEHPAWRPDFRDVGQLPDTKAVRTDFILNLAAILLVLGLGSWYGIREYTLQTVGAAVESQKEQIAENEAQNRQLLRWNGEFQRSARVAEEAIRFDEEPLRFPEFLGELAAMLPEEVVVRSIDLGHAGEVDGNKAYLVRLDGRVVFLEERSPSAVLTVLQERMRKLEQIGERLVEIEVADFNRDLELNVFTFSLRVTIRAKS